MGLQKLALALLAAAALAACGIGDVRVNVELDKTPLALPQLPSEISLPDVQLPAAGTPEPAAPAGAGYRRQPDGLPSARVTAVVDGDTVDVDLGGERVRLRLIGINTPETVDPRRPVECFGREASQKAKELLSGQQVHLEADPSQDDRDRYDRLLRYVWLPDGRLFNLEMVAQGYAFEYTYEMPYKYQAEFARAQEQARAAQRGLWAPDTCGGEEKPASRACGARSLTTARGRGRGWGDSGYLPPSKSTVKQMTLSEAIPCHVGTSECSNELTVQWYNVLSLHHAA